MNVQELWNLFSLCGTVCVRSTRFVNSDFAGPIFSWIGFFPFTWGVVLKNGAVKFSTRNGWTQRIAIVEESYVLIGFEISDFFAYKKLSIFLRGV